jgi:hypothetical protein
MRPDDLTDLLSALAGTPRLEGAACVGRHELFDLRDISDPDRAEVEARGVKICLTECGAYSQCRDWIQSLPARQRPSGVVAGVVRRPRTPAPVGRMPGSGRRGRPRKPAVA